MSNNTREGASRTKRALIVWGVVLVVGLAFTCVTPFVNDTWWFAPERTAFRKLLDVLRWVLIFGLFVYSRFFDAYAKARKAEKES